MNIENIRFATPCSVPWEDMDKTGNPRVRLCGTCDRKVYNLSAMTESEARSFLEKTEGSECVQLWKREDGTVVTADCPKPNRPPKIRLGGKPIPPPRPREPRDPPPMNPPLFD